MQKTSKNYANNLALGRRTLLRTVAYASATTVIAFDRARATQFWTPVLKSKTADFMSFTLDDAVWDGHVHLYNTEFHFRPDGTWGLNGRVKNFEGDKDLHIVFRLSQNGVTPLWQSDQKAVHVNGGGQGYPWKWDVGPDPVLKMQYNTVSILTLEPSVTG